MAKDFGGQNKTKSPAGSNSATRTKSGSTAVRSYDPKNTVVGGGKKPSIAKRYSPIGNDTPSAPSPPSL